MTPPGTPSPPLETWRWAPYAWRAAPLLTRRRADLLLRWRSAAGLPLARGRFAAMGLPEEMVAETLRRVRSVSSWDLAWTWAAQWFLGEARRQTVLGNETAAVTARRHAALAYHVAHFFVGDDPRKLRALRASATSLFGHTLTGLQPRLERVEVPWRTTRLPGLLVRPAIDTGSAPLVVLLNGVSTAKEETVLWSGAFLAHGLAVLALDWPGTGETAQTLPLTADCDDLTDGVLAVAAADPTLDPARVALVGVSLGGALAVGATAADRRIGAAVAVTPPYDAGPWLPATSPLLRWHLGAGRGRNSGTSVDDAARFSVAGVGRRLRSPLLIFGAGRDLVVPPVESIRLAAEVGETATLVWLPRGGHALYDEVAVWTDDAARWLLMVLSPARADSTGVDWRPSPSRSSPPASAPRGRSVGGEGATPASTPSHPGQVIPT